MSLFELRYDDYVAKINDIDIRDEFNWLALKSIFPCAWFSRLWVMQEAALGMSFAIAEIIAHLE